MALDLSSYPSIAAGLFVKLTFGSTVYRFSDWIDTVTIAGDSYTGLGNLLNVSASESQLKVSSGNVTVALSGIPDTSIIDILNSAIKGSAIEIRRGIFNPTTKQLLAIAGNPVGRFFGVVTNYSIQEEYDIDARTASNTIALECASRVEMLGNKIAGRRTNPTDQKAFFSTDLSMDRVPSLMKSIIDFGAPT
jgi:hypothetical protein